MTPGCPTSAAAVDHGVSRATKSRTLLLVFLAATVLGLVGLGVEVWRGGVIPRTAAVLTGLGLAGIPPIVVVGSESEPWSTGSLFAMAVSLLVGTALVWLGHGLWRERAVHGTSRGGRPTATA